MKQIRIPAAFIRGGTSKALVFHARDLPADPAERDQILLATMGSPDPYGRQLDGMGGGLSSLSKVCIVGPASHPEADIDYTKAQVQIKESRVDYHANCGNMSAAMGPFAVDEGLVRVDAQGEALIRIYNTNTRKLIQARFAVEDGVAVVDGNLVIPGVSGTGAPVSLAFLEPGGASTGKLLPTGHVTDQLDVPGFGKFEVSMIDAANACVLLHARDLGLTGIELPSDIEAIPGLLERLAAIRTAASLTMGIADNAEAAARKSIPIIGWVSDAQDAALLTGQQIAAADVDVTARMLSNGQPHRALPLTASLCLSVAARLEGSVVHAHTRPAKDPQAKLRIAMPSGILVTAANVGQRAGQWHVEQCTLLRTQRRLFDGYVYARAGSVTAKR